MPIHVEDTEEIAFWHATSAGESVVPPPQRVLIAELYAAAVYMIKRNTQC